MKQLFTLLFCGLFCAQISFGQCSLNLGADTVYVCAGDSVEFDAGPEWSSYLWNSGDTTQHYSIGYSDLVTLEVADTSGCMAYDTVKIIALNTQITDHSETFCPGDSVNLEGGLYADFDSLGSFTGVTYLPDGSGVNYEVGITVDGFPAGATVADVYDELQVCMTIEHSYLGDLEMLLTCPDGDSLVIFNSWTGEGIGPQFAGGFGGGNTFLGDALDQSQGVPGIGWDYCFSDVSSWGTMGEEHAGGNFMQTTMSSGSAMSPGMYKPEQPLQSFMGCQINGDWTITVRDNIGTDDGYIMFWGLGATNSLGDISYWWSTNETTESIVVMPEDSASYNVEMTFEGETCFDSTEILVSPLPTISVLVDSTECNMAVGSVNISSSGGSQPFAYDWNGEDPEFLSAGTYPLEMTDLYGCMVLDSSFSVPTEIGPVGPILGEACVFTGSEYEYMVPENECMTYDWSVIGGTVTSGQGTNAAIISWNDTTAGSISVGLTHIEGYTNSFTFLLDDCTGIIENVPDVSIAPNPVISRVRVSSDGMIEQISILDLSGRVLLNPTIGRSLLMELDLTGLQPGTYALNMIVDGHNVARMITKR